MCYLRCYWKQFAAVFTATLCSLCNGMETAWSSPAIPILMTNRTYISITHDDSYWLETLYLLGALSSLPITFSVLQFLGRKKSILLSGSISCISWILLATANSVPQLFVARFLSGFGANIAFVGIPMYLAEITEPNVRGFFGSFVYIMNLIGVLLAYAIIPYMPLYASAIIGAIMTFLQVASFSWQPESPYFLLTKSRNVDAEEMLRKLRSSTQNLLEEINLITKAVKRQNSERKRPIDLILIPSNRKAFLIILFLQSMQSMLGIIVITMNVHIILEKSGTSVSSQLSAILFAVSLLLGSMFGSLLIDKFGRKYLLITSSLLTALFLGILGSYFIFKDCYNCDMSNYKWVPVFALITYAVAFKIGAGLVIIVVGAELFPTSAKSLGMSLGCVWFSVIAILSIKMYYITVENYGMYLPFILFSLFAILTAVVVYFYVPETKGKTLEEIQMILKGRKNELDVENKEEFTPT